MTTPPCPPWCTEIHDPETEERFGDADHFAPTLHDPGGAFVALHRLDVDGMPGPVRVMVDRGPDLWLTPERTARFADALTLALIVSSSDTCSAA